jgi:hypothetical protein
MKKYLLVIAIFLGCVGCTEDKVNSPSEQEIPEPPKKEEVIKSIDEKHINCGYHTVTEVDGHRFYSIIRYEGGVALIHLPSCKCFKDSVK